MALKLGNLSCGCCGRECDICNSTRVPEYIDVTFAGLTDLYCDVQTSCDSIPYDTENTLILPHSVLNDTHRLTFNRAITDTYFPEGALPDECFAVYLSDEIDYGDAFIGAYGSESVSACEGDTPPLEIEDRWRRSAKVRLMGFLSVGQFALHSVWDYSNPADPEFANLGYLYQDTTEWACDGGTSDEFDSFTDNFADVTSGDYLASGCTYPGSSVTSLTATSSVATVEI